MGMDNIQVPPVGMRIPITPNDKAPSSVPRKKSKDGSRVEQTMNAQDEIKELKQRIAELEEIAKEEQEFPRNGEDYYVLTGTGLVVPYVWVDDKIDFKSKSLGNVFRTEEQAEFAVEKFKVETELRKFSRPFEEGKNNYFTVFDTNYANVDILGMSYSRVQGVIYFESEEKAQQAIESVGKERIKKYIFGVG